MRRCRHGLQGIYRARPLPPLGSEGPDTLGPAEIGNAYVRCFRLGTLQLPVLASRLTS